MKDQPCSKEELLAKVTVAGSNPNDIFGATTDVFRFKDGNMEDLGPVSGFEAPGLAWLQHRIKTLEYRYTSYYTTTKNSQGDFVRRGVIVLNTSDPMVVFDLTVLSAALLGKRVELKRLP